MIRKRELDKRLELAPSARNQPTFWLYLGLFGCAVYLVLTFLLSLYLIRLVDTL